MSHRIWDYPRGYDWLTSHDAIDVNTLRNLRHRERGMNLSLDHGTGSK
jgi:hypothetical protein